MNSPTNPVNLNDKLDELFRTAGREFRMDQAEHGVEWWLRYSTGVDGLIVFAACGVAALVAVLVIRSIRRPPR